MKESKILFTVLLIAMPLLATPVIALGVGVLWALILGNPMLEQTRKWGAKLLALSIVGLGAGMNLITVARVGLEGLGYTAIGIFSTFILGHFLSKLFKTERETSMLISVGTAICGGSAIAAVSSATRAKEAAVSVSLATVFLLNAIALVLFPTIGHALNLSQSQFGLWSALAIHDTSSVVGSSMLYGQEALQIATTVKLARALWIVPLTIVLSWVVSKQKSQQGVTAAKPKRPWFILGFLLMAAAFTWLPEIKFLASPITEIAKRGLILSLFCIGSGLSQQTLKRVGIRPVLLGVVLWAIVASLTLFAILKNWIH